MMVLLRLLVMDIFLFLPYTFPSSPGLYTSAAQPYAVSAAGSIPLRRPCHRESKSYVMCTGTVPAR
jgi:hypothetical protein